jgi:archaemetzincin
MPIARRSFVLAIAGVPLLGRWAVAAPLRVYLQPLGSALPEADTALVETALRAMLGVAVQRLERVELPAPAYYPPRRRYRAERLLAYLETRLPPGGGRILGLTGADISTTKDPYPDWGVLGLGELPGTATVISAFRCHKKSRSAEHARQRLAKVSVHEIGHSLGLEHCPNVGCLMEDAGGKVATCDREYDFCGRCRSLLAAAGHPLPAAPAIPWPRP